ncbi:MAG TPA: ABC transporter substrate-binding protein [Kineosporiaceae bacterium]|jgi:polar amino acid transport system substrate-binding protein|nr:ABC transporter substrate-binding protein [Kineosporiaceae bacterium]
MALSTRTRTAVTAAALGTALLVTACGSSSSSSSAASTAGGGSSAGGASGVTVAGVSITPDPALKSALPQKYRDAGQVRVASDVPYAPFEFFKPEGSQTIAGVDYDLGQAIGAKLGVKFAFTPQKFDGIIPAIQAGKFDAVISAMTDNAKRQAVLTFVDYSASGTGILVKKGNPNGIKSYKDLCGKAIAAQSGTKQVELVDTWQKDCAGNTIQLQQYPKDSDAQLAIASGKVVASILTKPAAGWAAKQTGQFEVAEDPAAPNGYDATPNGIGVPKADQELATAIQKALQSLIDDGTYTKILAEYGVEGIGLKQATINAGK